MNGEGDTPNGSQTADQDKKNDYFASQVISYLYLIFISIIHYLGLEKKCVVDELENEVKLLKKSESDLKSRTSQLENEVELMTIDKKVSDAKMTDKDNEIKSKAEETEYLKSRISELENEVQSAKENSKNTEIMIRAKFTDMSKLTEEEVYSEPTEHAGITWKMCVYKDLFNKLRFRLHGKKENEVGWFCPVIAEFLLFSQKSKKLVHRQERKMIYDAHNSSDWLMLFYPKDLFNEENGFVKDDSIIVAVALRAFPRSIHQTLEITIDAKFTDISKLTERRVYSQPTEFAGITWMINVHNSDSRIVFYLEGEKESAVGWWCPVIVEFRLISQKSKEIVSRRGQNLINDAENSSECLKIIPYKDLFDDEKGFVKDDSINVSVSLRVIPIEI